MHADKLHCRQPSAATRQSRQPSRKHGWTGSSNLASAGSMQTGGWSLNVCEEANAYLSRALDRGP